MACTIDPDGLSSGSSRDYEPVSATADSDGDGVTDRYDACPGHDDTADADGDGIADACAPMGGAWEGCQYGPAYIHADLWQEPTYECRSSIDEANNAVERWVAACQADPDCGPGDAGDSPEFQDALCRFSWAYLQDLGVTTYCRAPELYDGNGNTWKGQAWKVSVCASPGSRMLITVDQDLDADKDCHEDRGEFIWLRQDFENGNYWCYEARASATGVKVLFGYDDDGSGTCRDDRPVIDITL